MLILRYISTEEKKFIQVDVPAEFEYIFTGNDYIWRYLKKNHNVLIFHEAIVKSNPVFLQSKQTGNNFAKFTAMLRSALPWEKAKNFSPEQRGNVYVDCLAFEGKRNSPGGFILQNLRKGCYVSGYAVMRSGRKPVKHENDAFRSNWVYGDYLYANIKDIKIDREPKERKENPYNGSEFFIGDPRFNSQKSLDQYVTDDDLIFDI